VKKPNIEGMDYILSVLDKAETGPVVDEKDWDRKKIGATVKELTKEFDIAWDSDTYLTVDDDLADRLFAAGMELALRSGVYCVNTSRQMLWDRDELAGALDRAPAEITAGEGDDAVTFRSRRPDDASRVGVIGGAYGTLISEELFLPLFQAYAKEPLLEVIETPSLPTTRGRPTRLGSPMEAIVAGQEFELTSEALRRVGRPGLATGTAGTSGSEIIELAATTHEMYRQSDWHHASLLSEQKVSYADLTRAVHFAQTGSLVHCFANPIYGGYLGGATGLAIGCVASSIMLRACLFADSINNGPSHAHLSIDTHPDMLAAQGLAVQALARNTHLINSVFVRPAAGPVTRDILYENAAFAIIGVVSGAGFAKASQSASGRFEGHISPLEARFTGQVSHAVEGMSRKEAQPIVDSLVDKYAAGVAEGRIGKPFQEAYDLDSLEPTAEWQGLYEDVCAELQDEHGLVLQP